MENTLIITNGDSAADLLKESGYQGKILPWRDVLHDGPVPQTEDLSDLSDIRTDFLTQQTDMDGDKIRAGFRERDDIMQNCGDFSAIELWFEHDLYDQLQLIQILDFFAKNTEHPELSLVQADDYLGMQMPERIQKFAAIKQTVTEAQKQTASDAWAVFTGDDPLKLNTAFVQEDSLPFLQAARLRLMQEFPQSTNGLSKTQSHVLSLLAQGSQTAAQLFKATQDMEEAMFMGDLSFAHYLDKMIFAENPLITGAEKSYLDMPYKDYFGKTLSLTDNGYAVLGQQTDAVALNGIDRWIGGTHVTDKNLYLWDVDDLCLRAAA